MPDVVVAPQFGPVEAWLREHPEATWQEFKQAMLALPAPKYPWHTVEVRNVPVTGIPAYASAWYAEESGRPVLFKANWDSSD